MTRDELNTANAAAIRRHWRTLVDSGGQVPGELLGDLAAIADKHGAQLAGGTARELTRPADTPRDPATSAGVRTPTPPFTEDAKPAPRRAATRRTAK